MIAVSESTPGPIGINMSTYAGFKTGGVPGGILASLSLAFPSLVIITIITRVTAVMIIAQTITAMGIDCC